MSLHIGDTVPDFIADTTKGEISFHKWAADSRVFFFSHLAPRHSDYDSLDVTG